MEQAQNNGMAPLRPLPDQAQTWRTFERKPIPFDEAFEMVMSHHETDGVRDDLAINGLRSWAFGSTDGETMMVRKLPLPGRPGTDEAYPLRHKAWQQLCTRADAPADYLGRMPAKIQMACVNYDLSKIKKDALLRLAGGEARALLSSKYAPMDDKYYLQLVADTLNALGYREDALCRVVAAGPRTVLRVTIPNEARDMYEGVTIEHGIDIGNGELGGHSAQVTPVTFNLVCTNGMRAWKSEATKRMRHVGDPERLREQLADAVPVAFAEAKGDLDLWHKSTERLIDNALEEIESLHTFGFTKNDREAVGRQLAADNDLPGRNLTERLQGAHTSVFDMANAITALGRERGTGERDLVRIDARLSLEEAGHEYLRRRAA